MQEPNRRLGTPRALLQDVLVGNKHSAAGVSLLELPLTQQLAHTIFMTHSDGYFRESGPVSPHLQHFPGPSILVSLLRCCSVNACRALRPHRSASTLGSFTPQSVALKCFYCCENVQMEQTVKHKGMCKILCKNNLSLVVDVGSSGPAVFRPLYPDQH